jgi:hypothetical protein
MSGNRRRDLAEKLAAMTVERGCSPADAETAARLLAALSSDRELQYRRMFLWHARYHVLDAAARDPAALAFVCIRIGVLHGMKSLQVAIREACRGSARLLQSRRCAREGDRHPADPAAHFLATRGASPR